MSPNTWENDDNYMIHWPNLIQGRLTRKSADLRHVMNQWHPTLKPIEFIGPTLSCVPGRGAPLAWPPPEGARPGWTARPPGGESEQSSPRDGYCPGMCARPHFNLFWRRQGARAARDRSGSGRRRQDKAAGAGRTMAVYAKKGQVL